MTRQRREWESNPHARQGRLFSEQLPPPIGWSLQISQRIARSVCNDLRALPDILCNQSRLGAQPQFSARFLNYIAIVVPERIELPTPEGSGVTDRAHSTCSTPWKPSQTPAAQRTGGTPQPTSTHAKRGVGTRCCAEILHDAGSRAVKPQPTVTALTGLTDHPADDARFALANLLRFTA